MRQLVHTLGVIVLVGGLVAASGTVSGDQPPQPGTDESELDENETATLWSKDADECFSDEEYYDHYR